MLQETGQVQEKTLAKLSTRVIHEVWLRWVETSRMQLRLRLEITALKGPMYVWVPPPPGDRLWFSFVTAPQLVASATPLVRASSIIVPSSAFKAAVHAGGKRDTGSL